MSRPPVTAIEPVPLAVVFVAFAGALSALAGGYWDDAWHTERGRDDFFIAPHIAIYAGIAVAGAALTAWAALATRAHGLGAVRAHKPLLLALLAVGVTLASGPIDNAWHIAFGRDSVIWSPPHMLGIAGTLALGAALLAELAARSEGGARPLTIGAGALVLASATFVTVEYETDVPQFDEVWYLPALGLASAIGLMVVRLASSERWVATLSALVLTAFVLVVGGLIALGGFFAPSFPLIVAPALVVDVATRRRWNAPVAAVAFTAALFASHVPVRNLLGDGVRLDAADIALALPLTWLAVTAVFVVATAELGSLARGAVIPAAVLMLLWAAPLAIAHDPGQGDDAGTADLAVSVRGDRAFLEGDLPRETCGATRPVAVVARRAGEVERAPLSRDGCRVTGSVELPSRGRWFVYAEMLRGGDTIETWLPVTAGAGPQRVSEADRYAYVVPDDSAGVVKTITGVALYAAMLALLVATLALVRGAGRGRGAASVESARAT